MPENCPPPRSLEHLRKGGGGLFSWGPGPAEHWFGKNPYKDGSAALIAKRRAYIAAEEASWVFADRPGGRPNSEKYGAFLEKSFLNAKGEVGLDEHARWMYEFEKVRSNACKAGLDPKSSQPVRSRVAEEQAMEAEDVGLSGGTGTISDRIGAKLSGASPSSFASSGQSDPGASAPVSGGEDSWYPLLGKIGVATAVGYIAAKVLL